MALTYNNINQRDLNGFGCVVQGNDIDTVLILNLSKFPWLIFSGSGSIASGISAATGDETFSVSTATIAADESGDVIATITFDPAPPSTATLGLAATFTYNSL